jgi:hypothetical protein
MKGCLFRYGLMLFFSWGILCASIAQDFKASSVLSEGTYYKLGIPQAAIYKLDYAFLESLGLSPEQVDPAMIQVFTQRSGMLPQANAAEPADDLVEIPLYVKSEQDARFDPEDYLVFYAEGPGKTSFLEEEQRFVYEKNIYDSLHYVFLRVGQEAGLRISTQPSLIYGSGLLIREFDDFYHHEKDLHNLLQSGREWYGEEFWEEEPSLDLKINWPGLLSFQEMKVHLSAISRATEAANFSLSYNGQEVGRMEVQAAQATTFGFKARKGEQTFMHRLAYQPPAETSFHLQFEGGIYSGYLDHLTVQAQRELRLYDNQTAFRSIASTGSRISDYLIQTPPTDELYLWEVSDPLLPKRQLYRATPESIRFKTYNDFQLKEYVFFDAAADLPQPLTLGKISPQNLHSLHSPELLIISPGDLLPEAERLASFRREHDQLRVEVVKLPQIYHEFSSGRQDVSAIRNFIRLLYEQQAGLRYVLLFGDASYDYLDRISENTNQVPTYQSYLSTHDVHSYASDDFFAFLEEDEGDWPETSDPRAGHSLDVGIGRLPVNSLDEAKAVVDKLIHYATAPESLGRWRNRLLFVADDGDENKHQLMSDQLARYTETHNPELHPIRLFMDAFEREEYSAPAMAQALQKHIEQGVLLVDFIGHGGETAWTNEQILTAGQFADWKNKNRLPLLLTATCEFGRFDDPRRKSGAEQALLLPEGGAIGLLTTTRPVFPGTNFKVSSAFYQHAFRPLPDGSMPRLGDMFRLTKNASISGLSNRNFSLLGDPSMQLALPKNRIQVEGIFSDQGAPLDRIRPLQTWQLSAQVLDAEQQTDHSFDGIAYISIYDRAQPKETLGSDGPQSVMQYTSRERLLFRGQAKVRAGQIVHTLKLPKNVDKDFEAVKIEIYARHEDQLRDAMGSKDDLLMGGEAMSSTDQRPPQIRLYLNHRQFVNGGQVHPEPMLIALLEDESGINVTEGHHGIEASIYEQAWGPEQLGEYFLSEAESFTKGALHFPLRELGTGTYRLRLEASDNNLNRGSHELDFTISEDSVLIFSRMVAYPNPSPNGDIQFELSFAPSQNGMRLLFGVYNLEGQLIDKQQLNIPEGEKTFNFLWQGSAFSLPPGLYLYRLEMLGTQQQRLLSRQGKIVVQ